MKNLLYLCLILLFFSKTSSANNSLPSGAPLTVSVSTIAIVCNSTGGAYAFATGGVPPYLYSWADGSSSPNILPWSPGSYGVTVTDAVGATATATGFVFDESEPILINDIIQDVSVYGGQDGRITLSPVCGNAAPYTFLWSNGNTTQNMNNLSAGTYTVTVNDGLGCFATLAIPVAQPGPTGLTVEVISAPDIDCAAGCTTIQLASKTGFSYLWYGPNGFTTTTANPSICTPGWYTVVITSSPNGATASKSFRVDKKINSYDGILIHSSNPAFCTSNNSAACEQVCPNTTVTYTAELVADPCGPVKYTWTVTGVKDYSLSPDGKSITVNWAEPGAGKIVANASDLFYCYTINTRCITVQEEPQAKFTSNPVLAVDGTLRICKGQTVYFKNQSQHATQYEWQFSDDQSSLNSEDVEHTFATAGQFQLLQIARSQCFCADTSLLDIEVLDTETPLVECVSTICSGETITYSTSDNCGPYDWTVSPNGSVVAGGTASDNSITVQWLSGPDGFIELSAPNCGASACPEPALLRIPILSNQANIEGPTRVCPGEEAKYSIAQFEGTYYTWKTTGGGVLLEGQGTNEIRMRWGSPSTSSNKLIVTYENCYLGCSGSDTLLVQVSPPFGLGGPLELCSGASGNFGSALSTGSALSSLWTLYDPNGLLVWSSPAATVVNPGFTAGPGAYRLLAIPAPAAYNSTCSDSAEWKIQVAPLPAKPTGISGPGTFCPTQVLTFQANGIATKNEVHWQLKTSNAAPIEKIGNPVNAGFSAGSPRWVAARQVSTDGLACASDTIRLPLQALQPLPISGTNALCEGFLQKYSAPAITNLDYQWTVFPADAGVIHTGQGTNEVEIYWPRAGTYTVQLSVCGQISTQSVLVWPSPVPSPAFPAGVCAGEKGLATGGGSFASYRWKQEDGATISQANSELLSPGIYALVVTDAHGCLGTAEFSISEYPLPNFTITTTDPTGFCNNSEKVVMSALTTEDGDYQYEWFRDGVPLGVNQKVFSTNQYGYYTATATNQYGCTATDGPIHVFEHCGGICHNPSHVRCGPGTMDFSTAPFPECNRFQFQLQPGPNYVPGTAVWHFGESGASYLGQASGDKPQFAFPNAGKYLVVLYAKLDNGLTCVVIDSVNVEAVAQFEFVPACPADSSGFKDISTFLPQSGITAWNWNFGDPGSGGANTATGRMPKHEYAISTSYNVRLTVTANSGCTSTQLQTVQVPKLPVVSFTPQTTFCAGAATPLGILETDDFADIRWTFDDPPSGIQDSASGPQVYHRYALTGAYTPRVEVRNIAGCSLSLSQNLNIAPNLLSGDISPAGVTALCAGQSVQLSAPAVGTSYKWSTGTSGPQITVTGTGVYSVTVTDASGCTFVPVPKQVDILPVPSGTIKAYLFNEEGQTVGIQSNSLHICAGETVHLFTAQSANNSYQWSSGGTAITQIFSQDRFNSLSVGTHIFTITITNTTTGCTATTAPFPVTVNPVPSGFSATTDQICAGTPANVAYNGPQPPDWQFFWNNGETGPGFVTTEAGHYYVRVVNSFGCAANSETVTIKPGPNIAALPSGCHTRCTPDTLCLPALNTIAQWQWFFNGAAIPGADGPNLVTSESGVYWAELTDTSGCFAQSLPLTLELYIGTGDIYGSVWSDVNNNGVIDAGDTLVSGIAVNLWQNGIPAVAGQSGAGGAFVFGNVPSVNGFIAIDTLALPTAWEIVIGQSPTDLKGCAATAQGQLLLDQICQATSAVLQQSACPGTNFDYNGTPIPAGTSQSFVLQNYLGCDSVLTVNVSALPTSTGTLNASACPGTSFDYNGTLIPAGISQSFVLQNYLGCDSVLTVNVSTLPTSTGMLNASACPGTSFDYNGTLIPAGISQSFVLQNYLGCDSVLTVNVSALPTSTGTLNASACPGTSFDYNGTLIPAGISQSFVLQNYLGCDSVLTVNVSTLQTSTGMLNASACPGTSYDYNGTLIPSGSSQSFVLQNYLGCDSVLTVNVSALPTSTGTLNASACPGTSFDYNGTLIPAGISQSFVLQNYLGCDSVLTVNVSALPTSTGTLNASACPGTSFDYNGTLIPAGISQSFVLQNYLGCDSVLTVNVSTLQTSTGMLNASACPGTNYDYNGTLIPAGSSQSFVLQNYLGCDSVLTVIVSALQTSTGTLNASACPGTSYDYNGTLIPAGTSQTFVIQNTAGCDSLLTVVVTAATAMQTTLQTGHACIGLSGGSVRVLNTVGGTPPLSFSVDGQNYQAGQEFENLPAGAYTLWLQDQAGCVTQQPFVIEGIASPEFELPEVALIPCDQNAIALEPALTGNPGGLSYLWSDGSTAAALTVSSAGPVWLELSNVCATLRKTTEVYWENGATAKDLIYVPNVFMPEAQNPVNTVFRPEASAELLFIEYRLEVYDRWGSLVFRTQDAGAGWTGLAIGDAVNPGVYVWLLKARAVYCGREADIFRTGNVTVLR